MLLGRIRRRAAGKKMQRCPEMTSRVRGGCGSSDLSRWKVFKQYDFFRILGSMSLCEVTTRMHLFSLEVDDSLSFSSARCTKIMLPQQYDFILFKLKYFFNRKFHPPSITNLIGKYVSYRNPEKKTAVYRRSRGRKIS